MLGVSFICHRYYLAFWATLAPVGVAYIYLKYVNGEFNAQTAAITCALLTFYFVLVIRDSPRIQLKDGTLILNHWLYRNVYDFSEIREIAPCTTITGVVNPHNGIQISLRSGETIKKVCAPEYAERAADYFRAWKA